MLFSRLNETIKHRESENSKLPRLFSQECVRKRITLAKRKQTQKEISCLSKLSSILNVRVYQRVSNKVTEAKKSRFVGFMALGKIKRKIQLKSMSPRRAKSFMNKYHEKQEPKSWSCNDSKKLYKLKARATNFNSSNAPDQVLEVNPYKLKIFKMGLSLYNRNLREDDL